MSLDLMHRRLIVGMGFVALAAFAGGAGFEPISTALAALALTLAFVWQPDSGLSLRLERFWLPVAAVLVLRSLYHVFLVGDDVVIPVVDLLLLLLCAEALRSLEAQNDTRLYYLTLALLVASTAYRPGVLFAWLLSATSCWLPSRLSLGTYGGRPSGMMLERKWWAGDSWQAWPGSPASRC